MTEESLRSAYNRQIRNIRPLRHGRIHTVCLTERVCGGGSMKDRSKREETLLGEVRGRLQAMESAMERLAGFPVAQGPFEKSLSGEEKEYVLQTVAEDVCRKCPGFRTCHVERKEGTRDEILRMAQQAMERGEVSVEMVSEGFRKDCIYFSSFMEEMGWLHYALFQKRSWEKREGELRRLMKKQAELQYSFLRQCRRMLSEGNGMEEKEKRRLAGGLLRRGIWLRAVVVLPEESGLLRLCLNVTPLRAGGSTETVGKILKETIGKRMAAEGGERRLRSGENALWFVEEGSFFVLFGCCRQNKQGEQMCGDTFSFLHPGARRAVMLLSDGAGTGKRAYEESRRVMEACETLLEAGLPEELAMEMLHTALLMEGGDTCSTMDVAVISLKTGRLKMLKAGGAATFVLHHSNAERLRPAGLPPGSPAAQAFVPSSRKLYDGDMVIMLSDGMLEFETAQESTLSMEQMLAQIHTKNAQSFAEQLMSRMPPSPRGRGDDRTVLVAALWEKSRGRRDNNALENGT